MLAVLGLCAFACAKRAPMDSATPTDAIAPGAHSPEAATADDAKGEASPAMPSGEPDAIKSVTTPRSLDEMTASLDELEGELREQGVRLRTYRKAGGAPDRPKRPPTKKTTPSTPTTSPSAETVAAGDDDPCLRICAIATAVCDLKDHICTLADEHQDEPRYAAACKRATRDCTRATEACDDCS